MKCQNCRAVLPPNTRICEYCDAKVEMPESQHGEFLKDLERKLTEVDESVLDQGSSKDGKKLLDMAKSGMNQLKMIDNARKKKVLIIQNFSMPRNQNDLYDLLIHASTTSKSLGSGVDKIANKSMANAWNAKAAQAYHKLLVIAEEDEKLKKRLKPFHHSYGLDDSISSEVRAIIFNVFNSLGILLINEHSQTIKNLNEHDKASISRAGIRVGAKFFFMPNLLKKNQMELNALLWKVFYDAKENLIYPLPLDGRVSFFSENEMPDSYWSAIGYKCLNKFALRIDIFERVFYLARQKLKYGPFLDSSDMMNPLGCNSDELANILNYCGYKSLKLQDNRKLFYLNQKKQESIKKIPSKKTRVFNIKQKVNRKNDSPKINIQPTKKENKADPNSPFAVLEKLL